MPNSKTKRNYYISYIKGWAIISIMLIHLLDWSNRILSKNQLYFKELLYPSVLFFIAAAGGLVYIAYGKYNLWTAAKKSFRRGGELIGVYFLYNILKLYVYNFSAEPFYAGFISAGKLNLADILSLKSFTSPISIILTIGGLLIISPLFLALAKSKYPKTAIGALIVAVAYLNYFLPLPSGALTDFLYAKNNIMFPIMLWLLPFLICFYLAMFGLEKHKGKLLFIFIALSAGAGITSFGDLRLANLTGQMYPLQLFYVFFSFAFMFFLIYVFYFLERARNRAVNLFLAVIRLLGDSTLAVYIYHWLVIDATLWAFYPKVEYIWFTVPLFWGVYLFLRRGKLAEYYESYQYML